MNSRGFATFWRGMVGRAYPRVIAMNRDLAWVAFDVLLPLLGTAALALVYIAMQAPREFIGFVILGGAMSAYWMNVLWSMAAQLYWEKETGNLEVMMLAPTSRMAILLGMALGGMYSTTVRAAAVILAGSLLFGVSYEPSNWLLLILVFLVTLGAVYGLGMLFASLFLLWGREAWHVSNALQEPVFLLSGFYFPVKSLGFVAAAGASLIPLTLGLDAMRQVLFPAQAAEHGFLDPLLELGILAVLMVVLLLAARAALRYMERLSKREGRMTIRWQ